MLSPSLSLCALPYTDMDTTSSLSSPSSAAVTSDPTMITMLPEEVLLLQPKLEEEQVAVVEAAANFPRPPPFLASSSSSSSLQPTTGTPRPLESLQGAPLPPFLSKTYDLVSESSLDAIISWAPAGNSFVVWDPSVFARDILPHHFKHNNFSSFVRQLNTYGFRKVHADRWEFANEDFLRGNKPLLKNIVRRRSSQVQQSSIQFGSLGEIVKSNLEPELDVLRREKNTLMQEVGRLKQEHLVTIEQMNTLNQQLESAEDRQKQMVSFLAKVLQNPTFLRQLKLHKEQKEIASTRVKRKFLKHIPHGHTDSSGESSSQQIEVGGLEFPASCPMAPAMRDDEVRELPNLRLEDMGMKLGVQSSSGMEFVGGSEEDVDPFMQGFDAEDELGIGLEDYMMPEGSTHQPDKIGSSKGKDSMCGSGSGAPACEAECLAPFPGDEQVWPVDDALRYMQSPCSAGDDVWDSLVSGDADLMEFVGSKQEKYWELDFQALEGDQQLGKHCVVEGDSNDSRGDAGSPPTTELKP